MISAVNGQLVPFFLQKRIGGIQNPPRSLLFKTLQCFLKRKKLSFPNFSSSGPKRLLRQPGQKIRTDANCLKHLISRFNVLTFCSV